MSSAISAPGISFYQGIVGAKQGFGLPLENQIITNLKSTPQSLVPLRRALVDRKILLVNEKMYLSQDDIHDLDQQLCGAGSYDVMKMAEDRMQEEIVKLEQADPTTHGAHLLYALYTSLARHRLHVVYGENGQVLGPARAGSSLDFLWRASRLEHVQDHGQAAYLLGKMLRKASESCGDVNRRNHLFAIAEDCIQQARSKGHKGAAFRLGELDDTDNMHRYYEAKQILDAEKSGGLFRVAEQNKAIALLEEFINQEIADSTELTKARVLLARAYFDRFQGGRQASGSLQKFCVGDTLKEVFWKIKAFFGGVPVNTSNHVFQGDYGGNISFICGYLAALGVDMQKQLPEVATQQCNLRECIYRSALQGNAQAAAYLREAAKGAGSDAAKGLGRFTAGQNNLPGTHSTYQVALGEMKNGAKTTHWIWYIFPQFEMPGVGPFSKKYSIANLDEARAYLLDDTLGARLREITGEVLKHKHKKPLEIFGSGIDVQKFKSCMTLFAVAHFHNMTAEGKSHDEAWNSVFVQALEQFYGGQVDQLTTNRLNMQHCTKVGDLKTVRLTQSLY